MGDINFDRLLPLEPAWSAQKREASGEDRERRQPRKSPAAPEDQPSSDNAESPDEEAASFDSFA